MTVQSPSSTDLFAVLADGLPEEERAHVVDLVRRSNEEQVRAAQAATGGRRRGSGGQARGTRRPPAPAADYQPVLLDRDR